MDGLSDSAPHSFFNFPADPDSLGLTAHFQYPLQAEQKVVEPRLSMSAMLHSAI